MIRHLVWILTNKALSQTAKLTIGSSDASQGVRGDGAVCFHVTALGLIFSLRRGLFSCEPSAFSVAPCLPFVFTKSVPNNPFPHLLLQLPGRDTKCRAIIIQ